MNSWSLGVLSRVASELLNYRDGRHLTADVLDYFHLSLELVYREVLMMQASHLITDEVNELLRQALLSIEDMQNHECLGNTRTITPQRAQTGSIGRPCFSIPREQLYYLIETRFTVPQIADMIGVSVRTVHRRMSEYGLSIHSMYSEMTDQELDEIISVIHQEFPMCGNRQMNGHLLSRGIRVQQHRIRDSMRRTDPEGTIARRLHTVHHRRYSVAAPRSLYHIDGNHKLIRYVNEHQPCTISLSLHSL